MPMRGELLAPAMRAGWAAKAPGFALTGILEFFSNPELAVVVCFCVAGLVASISLALSFPFSGEIAEILAQIL
jgi:hypothetical protein